MVRLAQKAFYPAKPPFPLMHVDTTWKFREMIAVSRELRPQGAGPRRDRPHQRGRREAWASIRSTHSEKAHRRDEDRGAEAGARQIRVRRGLRRRPARRGKVAGQGTRLLVPRQASIAGTPRTSGPNCGTCTTREVNKGESIRVFPLSNWTELDVWQYIHLEKIPIVPLYFAAERPVVQPRRHADHGRRRPAAAEARREARDEAGPLPHARLLPADRRRRIHRHDAARNHPGNAAAPRPPNGKAG